MQTTLTPAQVVVVVEIRILLLLSLDDLPVITHQFINPAVFRSGLDRCLGRHGVCRLADPNPKPDKARLKTFNDYEPAYVLVGIKYPPQMADEDQRTYLFVAIDRTTRWVHVEINQSKSGARAKAFLNRVIKQPTVAISALLTNNDKALTVRINAQGRSQPTGHPLCQKHDIVHGLIGIRRPQANGMMERFNGRIAEGLATTRF